MSASHVEAALWSRDNPRVMDARVDVTVNAIWYRDDGSLISTRRNAGFTQSDVDVFDDSFDALGVDVTGDVVPSRFSSGVEAPEMARLTQRAERDETLYSLVRLGDVRVAALCKGLNSMLDAGALSYVQPTGRGHTNFECSEVFDYALLWVDREHALNGESPYPLHARVSVISESQGWFRSSRPPCTEQQVYEAIYKTVTPTQ